MNRVKRLRLGFLASHGGSNMQAIIDACREGRLAADPVAVISNNSGSTALERAKREGIFGIHLSSGTHPNSQALDAAILTVLEEHRVDLVILAGYMKKLGERTLQRFKGRVLNIHPALLPKYGGAGMYGRLVHEAVLAAGEKVTGITIHLVDEEYDHGMILNQCQVPVEAGDTPDTLSARVLRREHQFFVETLQLIVAGKISLDALTSKSRAGTNV